MTPTATTFAIAADGVDGTTDADIWRAPARAPAFYAAGSGDDLVIGHGFADTLFGNAGHDTLRGGGGDDMLYGNGGRDVLKGGSGADTLAGGLGNDVLAGGEGDDVFVIDAQRVQPQRDKPDDEPDFGTLEVDRILDWQAGDTIEIANATSEDVAISRYRTHVTLHMDGRVVDIGGTAGSVDPLLVAESLVFV